MAAATSLRHARWSSTDSSEKFLSAQLFIKCSATHLMRTPQHHLLRSQTDHRPDLLDLETDLVSGRGSALLETHRLRRHSVNIDSLLRVPCGPDLEDREGQANAELKSSAVWVLSPNLQLLLALNHSLLS